MSTETKTNLLTVPPKALKATSKPGRVEGHRTTGGIIVGNDLAFTDGRILAYFYGLASEVETDSANIPREVLERAAKLKAPVTTTDGKSFSSGGLTLDDPGHDPVQVQTVLESALEREGSLTVALDARLLLNLAEALEARGNHSAAQKFITLTMDPADPHRPIIVRSFHHDDRVGLAMPCAAVKGGEG